MPVVDISTVIIVLILGHCLSIFFLAFDLFQYETTKYDYLFLLGRALQAIAWGLIVAREVLPIWLSFSVGNSVLFLGWMMESLAVISLKYVVTTRCTAVYASIVAFSQLALWPIFGMEQTVAVLVASFLSAFMFLIPGRVLLFSRHRSSPLQKILGAMYCLCCSAVLWRGVDVWIQGGYRLFAAKPSQVVPLLALGGLLLIGCLGYVLVKKEKLSREMKTYADTDLLTNLYNRRAFLLLANQLIKSAIRKNESVALMIIDIDHFKRINDRYGHGVGDGIIANLAQVMRVNMRQSDIACRYGGEEFVILLPDCDKTTAVQAAERLRLAVERATPDFIFYTVSIGVSAATGKQIRLENVINQADMAMYKAKDMGRNRVQSE
ncbi:hypothetical protein AXX12_10695 [Anaerosporomusa subterranea]|uniref:GGDEF domain-containing protein n=1 Tax=Anaerosporomusa subterranea TaxID=1794912 RepID=A0A154BNU0_ANASB|nr:GGDEF domain-containing protein [Anaerosporomusa subterranea]KYZ75673.1 hypothetical protein AXX12_10695 [Anaerosporomusa subterranea]